MRALDLTLLTDLYELTMMQGYFKNPTDQVVVFDAFYRQNPCDGGYAIAAGLEQVIEYVRDLHFSPDDVEYLRGLNLFDDDFLEYLRGFHFTGDIYAIPEGTVVFPREPLLKVVAPVMEAQLVETAILNIINHQSLIATKASRVVYAAKGDGIMDLVFAVPRLGCRYLRCKSCCDRRLRGNFQRADRKDVRCPGQRYTRTQLDHEFSG